MRSLDLWDYSSYEIREMAPELIAIQPIGSVEQHGPHLPLATDTIIAQAFTDGLKEKVRENNYPGIFLPTLPFSKSNEHMDFPGTIALSARTMFDVLMDIGTSCHRAGFKKLVFINGHGGNTEMLGVAAREIRIATGMAVFAIMPSLLIEDKAVLGIDFPASESKYGIHGGLTETSAVMYKRPELVHNDKIVDCTPDYFDHTSHLGFNFAVQFGWKAQDISRLGPVGDPTGAAPELGKRWLECISEELYKTMLDIRDFELYK